VRSWETLLSSVTDFNPDVFYYYGHGQGTANSTRLVAASELGAPIQIPTVDVANVLRPPADSCLSVAYINCCLGNAGGFLGVGYQLATYCPVVVTNSLTAFSETAQSQALLFFDEVLLRGHDPRWAIATVYRSCADFGLSVADARWMTPLLFANYDSWQSSPPERERFSASDPNWRLKLDRLSQFGQIYYEITSMLREGEPRSLFYVWFGRQDQAVELFHDRINVELKSALGPRVMDIRPCWPDETYNHSKAFEDLALAAFEVVAPPAIPGRIRTRTKAIDGEGAIVVVRHQSLSAASHITVDILRLYMEWWDACMTGHLEKANAHAVLGLRFTVRDPERFQQIVSDRILRLTNEFRNSHFRLLPELRAPSLADLSDFVRVNRFPVPTSTRESLLVEVLARTKGAYEPIVSELQREIDRAWSSPLQRVGASDGQSRTRVDF
jgi:hypothetical protein